MRRPWGYAMRTPFGLPRGGLLDFYKNIIFCGKMKGSLDPLRERESRNSPDPAF